MYRSNAITEQMLQPNLWERFCYTSFEWYLFCPASLQVPIWTSNSFILLPICLFSFNTVKLWPGLVLSCRFNFSLPHHKKKIHSSVILFEQSYCTCAVSNNRNNSCIRNRQVHSCLCSEIKRSQVQENPWEYIQLHTPTVARQQRRYIKAMYTICTNMSHCRQANW